MLSSRKLKLTIIGDKEKRNKDYKFIRDSQYAQYQGLNILMGELASAYYKSNRDTSSELYKETRKGITNSNPLLKNINFGTGIDTPSMITQKVKKDFDSCKKNGLAKGERSITNYKRTFPLMTRGRNLKFEYENDESNNVIIKWVGKGKDKIVFKVILGQQENENTVELRHTLHKIINKEYKVSQSSLYFDKKNKLILNLSIDIPNTSNIYTPIKNRVLGVDLGIKYPAYMCLSDNTYIRQHIGGINDFLRVREQIQERRKRLQQSLSLTKGGKGRKKKLQKLDKLKENEKNFVQTYNHAISKKIVQFAKKNKCEYIALEALTKDGFPNSILRNWSYYQLQEFIEYKAKREGIKVVYVDPAYTSQTCSQCGNIDKENRPSQEIFKCTECGFELNADHNAAINIARKALLEI